MLNRFKRFMCFCHISLHWNISFCPITMVSVAFVSATVDIVMRFQSSLTLIGPHYDWEFVSFTAPTVVKQSSLLALKDLVSLHYHRRRRESRDLVEPLGLLFGRDLDQICCDGRLGPSLAVSHCRRPACTAGLP